MHQWRFTTQEPNNSLSLTLNNGAAVLDHRVRDAD